MGLNYMFLTDNMKDAQGNAYGDNVFCYDPTQLAAMNQSFINNPTSN
jgi:hypothetical protein